MLTNFDGAKELREKLMAAGSADELLSMLQQAKQPEIPAKEVRAPQSAAQLP